MHSYLLTLLQTVLVFVVAAVLASFIYVGTSLGVPYLVKQEYNCAWSYGLVICLIL